MTFLTLIASALVAQQATPPAALISYESAAKSMGMVVSELQEKVGKKLAVTPQMAKEIVIVSVHDVPSEALLAQLAKSVAGSWSNSSDGVYTLYPDNSARNFEARDERLARQKAIQAAIEKMNADAKKSAGQDDAAAGVAAAAGAFLGQASSAGPVGRAILRLVTLLGSAAFADILSGDRVVFATTPTRMQQSLPSNANPIIADLIRDYNVYAKKQLDARQEQAGGANAAEIEQMQKFMKAFGINTDEKPIEGQVTKALLIAARSAPFAGMFGGSDSDIRLELRLFDSKGDVVLTGASNLTTRSMEDLIRQMDPTGATTGVKPTEEKAPEGEPIKYSDLTKEFLQISNVMDAGNISRKKLTDELQKRLIRPDLYDPMSYQISEDFLATAKAKKQNMIAVVPDTMGSISIVLPGQSAANKTTEQVYNDLKNNAALKVTTDGSWLLIRPAFPVSARRDRADRVALTHLITSSAARVIPALDDLAAYAISSPPPAATPVVIPYILYFAPSALSSGMRGPTNWDALRLYGSLTTPQRALLGSNGRIQFSGMTLQQAAIVRHLTYGADARLTVGRNLAQQQDNGFMSMIRQFMPQQAASYLEEPTELMPNGLPGSGFLQVTVTNENFVLPTDEGGSALKMMGGLGVQELAMFKYMSDSPMFAAASGAMPKIEKVRMGDRKVIDMTLRYNPEVMQRHSLIDDSIDANSAEISLDQLPQRMQDRIAKEADNIKKSAFGAMIQQAQQAQQKKPPPAR